MIGRILEHKLLREGYRVSWARSAAEAGDVASGDPCDVALIDLDLEGGGFELAASLAARGCAPRAGWLAMVAQRDLEGVARAQAAGAAGTVLKPFKPTVVAAMVRDVLDGSAVP